VRLALILALGAALTANAASAQTAAPAPAWTISGMAGVVSDYRYRGYSLSGRDPAAQAELTATHRSGAYADLYLSSIEEYGVGRDGDGAKVEATVTGGWAGGVRGFDLNVALAAYLYPDGTKVSYLEIPAQVGQTFGPITWTLGGAYAPAQAALFHKDNGYVWGGLDYAFHDLPVTASARLGYESGAYAPGGKTDWSVGLKANVRRLQLGLSVIDSDRDPAALVGSLFVVF
jgi:uncharacterized protein (TIGR02001 family)